MAHLAMKQDLELIVQQQYRRQDWLIDSGAQLGHYRSLGSLEAQLLSLAGRPQYFCHAVDPFLRTSLEGHWSLASLKFARQYRLGHR